MLSGIAPEKPHLDAAVGTAAGDHHSEVAGLQRGERSRRSGAAVPLEGAAITAGEHDRLRPGDPLQR